MTLPAWLALAASALAAPAFTGDEEAALDAARAMLPAAILPEGVPLDIRRGRAEHPRARRQGGRIVVVLRGGDAAGEDLVHALTDLADRGQRWSRAHAWRSLSAWEQRAWGWTSPERSPRAFADPRARRGPREDLAEMAEWAWAPKERTGRTSPACDAPSKWAALHELVGVPAPEAGCAAVPVAPLSADAVTAVDVLFVSPTAASPASISGHMLVAVHMAPDARGIERHTGFGLIADTTGAHDGSPLYVLSGFTGSFPSRVQREPVVSLDHRYATVEGRDVRRLRLALGEAERARLLRRLAELERSWDRPYLITSRNCTALVVELADAAWGVRPPEPISPDVLAAWLVREGRAELLPMDRPESLGLSARAHRLSGERTDVLGRLSEREPRLVGVADGLEAEDPARRAAAYAVLAEMSARADLRAEVGTVLAWSDVVERARHPPRADGLDAWDALHHASARIRAEEGAGWASVARRHELTEDALRMAAPASEHTPYRPLLTAAVARLDREGVTPWLALATPFYVGRQGGGRRFGQAPGMAMSLLDSELLVPLDRAPVVRGRVRVASMRHLDPLMRPRRIGFGLGLVDLRSSGLSVRRSEQDWAWVEGLLAVATTDDLRNHLLLSVGASATRWSSRPTMQGGAAALLSADGVPVPTLAWTGIGLPIGLSGQLQRRGVPLTHIAVDARVVPAWAPTRGAFHRADGGLTGQLFVGSVRAWDAALHVRAEARTQPIAALDAPLPPLVGELRAGFTFERW